MFKHKIRKFFKRRKALGITLLSLMLVIVLFLALALSSGIPKVDSVLTYNGDNPYIQFYKRTLLAAHRAGAGIAPENSLAAFESCMNAPDYRADILEFDLHLTSDDKLVLLHDETLDRTSNAVEYFGHKNVNASEKTYAELRNLNMAENFETDNGDFPLKGLRGEEIPDNIKIITLTETLEFLRTTSDYDLKFIIEIKNDKERGEKAVDLLYKQMVDFDIVDKTIIGTFNKSVSDYLDTKYPQLTRSASIAEVLDFYFCSIFNVDLAKRNFKFKVLQIPYKTYGLNFGKKSIVDYAHHYGIAVQYWTINKEKDIRHLVNIGADAIITDYPALAQDIIYRG